MNIVFWLNSLSPHQLPYITCLLDDKRVNRVICVAADDVTDERKEMGWGISDVDENIEIKRDELSAMENGEWINDSIICLAGRKSQIFANEKNKENGQKVMFLPPPTLQFFRHYPKETAMEAIPSFDFFSNDIV